MASNPVESLKRRWRGVRGAFIRLTQEGFNVQSLDIRRLDRSARKALETNSNLSPQAFLDAAVIADNRGDPFALSSVGRVDPFSTLVKIS